MTVCLIAKAQDTINLFECYQEAISSFPIHKEKLSLEEIYNLKVVSLKRNWYPKLDFKAQATLQSDVTSLADKIPEIPGLTNSLNFPVIDKDQYKTYIEIYQLLFNGGLNDARKSFEKANLNVNSKSVDVELNLLKDRINKIYFSILYSQKQKQIMETMNEELEERLASLKKSVEYGRTLQSNYNLLLAEKYKVGQQIKEIEINIDVGKMVLSEIIGVNVDAIKESS